MGESAGAVGDGQGGGFGDGVGDSVVGEGGSLRAVGGDGGDSLVDVGGGLGLDGSGEASSSDGRVTHFGDLSLLIERSG